MIRESKTLHKRATAVEEKRRKIPTRESQTKIRAELSVCQVNSRRENAFNNFPGFILEVKRKKRGTKKEGEEFVNIFCTYKNLV